MMIKSFLHQLWAWFRLFRWNNLFIIALTMILVRYSLIHPLLGGNIDHFPLTHFNFLLLILSIVFTAAGGYVINDYFDVRIDRINRPDRIILGRYVTFRQAINTHQVFSVIGIILGFYSGYKVGSVRIGGIQAVMVAVLWFYSYRYKGLFLWGNIVVAVLSGMTIIIVWLFEFYSLRQDALVFGSAIPGFKVVNKFILSYFVFAVLISFARELMKDAGDVAGDSRYGCNTLAVKSGPGKAIKVAQSVLIFSLLMLVMLQFYSFRFISKPLLIYSVVLLDLPMIWIIFKMIKPKELTEIQKIEKLLKYLMVSGVLSMVFITL